jgi:asparagine synthase (glutamine-hydrolysing)
MAAVFGIVGPTHPGELAAMGARLAHRGRVASTCQLDGISLGLLSDHPDHKIHRDASVVLASDLQIFNEPALRRNLDPQPPTLEALVSELYRRQGIEALAMPNGEFALALWDAEREELVLSRDYVGCRPLFLTRLRDGRTAFASEYKALLSLSDVNGEADLEMLQHLQHYKQLPSDRTLLADVRSLPPGSALVLDRAGRKVTEFRFPSVPLRVKHLALTDARDRLEKTLLEVLEARIGGRRRVGIALSGGIDSIGLACACRHLRPDMEIHTFTAGSGGDDPEILAAAYVSEKIDAVHHRVIVSPDALVDELPKVIWHLEDPIARSEALQFYAIGQTAGEYTDLLISGAASDGIFAGMPRHKILYLMRILPFLRQPLTEFYTLTQSGRRPRSWSGRLMGQLYFRGEPTAVPRVRGSSFEPPLAEFPQLGPEFINRVLSSSLQESVARWLAKEERTLRAGGVNDTLPFLDRRMIELGFTISDELKIRRGKEKFILRRALRSLVPDEVLNRPKFPMRMKYGSAFSDHLEMMAHRYLSRERVEARGWFDWQDLQQLFRRGPGGIYSDEKAMRLWTALSTEIWAEQFLDGGGAPPSGVRHAPRTGEPPA